MKVKTFMLPDFESELNLFLEKDSVEFDITDKKIFNFAKSENILYLIEYEEIED